MTDDMMKQIRTFTKCNLDLAQQRSMLKKIFSDRTILSWDLSNAIQKVKHEYADVENDVVKLLEWFTARKIHIGLFAGRDFYKCRNTISVEEFLARWQQLKEMYSAASDYLVRALEQSQKSWAQCYTATIFVAGVQSTQRIEGYNSVIKRVVNGNTTL
ncbi:hypothetical protein C1646_764287 [Rhizophagus diaphanus]|nr:hypothetical protein C1646_764287 [Rhizophagus diaphanus] [Rhizophagus sp. MUCL 43196]